VRHVAPFSRWRRDTLVGGLKTVALLIAFVSLQPGTAAEGQEITVTGTPARTVVLEALETTTAPVRLGVIGPTGTLTAEVPDVPAGRYRVVVAGESEAPVLEVVALSRETSLLLLGFGFLLVLGFFVAGIVVHRRWRDAIS
jgi:ABC-type Fe3+-hydroxamate transport system substrate-binding protein